jgi:Ca2+-binding RTX toxin-like protein
MLLVEQLESRLALSSFFVATNGNDANDGSFANPWRTLQHAADTVQAGDLVTVRAGNYAGFDLWTDGTAANPITFRGETGAVINAPNQRTADGINLEGADWIVIEGFTVTGLPRAGIRSVINSHVTIRNNVCDANGRWGIFTGHSYDLLIENNITSRSVAEHGIYVSNSGDRPVIRGNVSFSNNGCGIHMNGDISQGGDGIISEALVERNTLYDNGRGGGSAINGDGVQNSRFQNNLIYNSHASGISLYRIDGGGSSKNNVVVNNTVIVASDGRWALNISDGSTGNTVYNNIFYSYHSYRGALQVDADCLSGFTSNWNVIEDRCTTDDGSSVLTLAQWRTATGQDANSLVATPEQLFVSLATDDYHLSPTSPAIDRGTGLQAPPVDLEGNSRPRGVTFDVGSYESGSGGGGGGGGGGGSVGLEDDPWNPGKKVLVARGTDANDDILLKRGTSTGTVAVYVEGTLRGQWSTSQFVRILVHGLAGNDVLTVESTVSVACQINGGSGNDTVQGGAGNNLLLGGDGDDLLTGRSKRDIMIGGLGADQLFGNSGSDLLIGGTTSHEASDAALKAISGEWNSSRSYSTRTSRLATGYGGLPRLDASTVFDDNAVDRLTGGSSSDWFFGKTGQDIMDRSGSERLN